MKSDKEEDSKLRSHLNYLIYIAELQSQEKSSLLKKLDAKESIIVKFLSNDLKKPTAKKDLPDRLRALISMNSEVMPSEDNNDQAKKGILLLNNMEEIKAAITNPTNDTPKFQENKKCTVHVDNPSILSEQDMNHKIQESVFSFGDKKESNNTSQIEKSENGSISIETSQEIIEKYREPSHLILSQIPKTFSNEIVLEDGNPDSDVTAHNIQSRDLLFNMIASTISQDCTSKFMKMGISSNTPPTLLKKISNEDRQDLTINKGNVQLEQVNEEAVEQTPNKAKILTNHFNLKIEDAASKLKTLSPLHSPIESPRTFPNSKSKQIFEEDFPNKSGGKASRFSSSKKISDFITLDQTSIQNITKLFALKTEESAKIALLHFFPEGGLERISRTYFKIQLETLLKTQSEEDSCLDKLFDCLDLREDGFLDVAELGICLKNIYPKAFSGDEETFFNKFAKDGVEITKIDLIDTLKANKEKLTGFHKTPEELAE